VIFPLWDDTWEVGEGGELRPAPIHLYGRNKLHKAIAFYRDAVARFGLHTPWASVEALHYTADTETNRVVMPAWIADEVAVEAAAYADDVTQDAPA